MFLFMYTALTDHGLLTTTVLIAMEDGIPETPMHGRYEMELYLQTDCYPPNYENAICEGSVAKTHWFLEAETFKIGYTDCETPPPCSWSDYPWSGTRQPSIGIRV